MNEAKVKRAIEILSRNIQNFREFGYGFKPVEDSLKELEELVKPKELTEEILKELDKYVDVVNLEDGNIIIMDSPIPSRHLTCIRGVFCDFYETTNFIHVYIK
jgi:hypothetical protein